MSAELIITNYCWWKKNLTTFDIYETYGEKHGDILHISPGISMDFFHQTVSPSHGIFFQPPDFHLQHGGL